MYTSRRNKKTHDRNHEFIINKLIIYNYFCLKAFTPGK
jgi:hypothetical protein